MHTSCNIAINDVEKPLILAGFLHFGGVPHPAPLSHCFDSCSRSCVHALAVFGEGGRAKARSGGGNRARPIKKEPHPSPPRKRAGRSAAPTPVPCRRPARFSTIR